MLELSQRGSRTSRSCSKLADDLKDIKPEIVENFEEGLRRRPDWKALEKPR
jgi:hypothetical protein